MTTNKLQAWTLVVTMIAAAASTAGTVAAGEAWWYAVRGTNCGGDGSYDPVAPGQQGTRDAEIESAAGACP